MGKGGKIVFDEGEKEKENKRKEREIEIERFEEYTIRCFSWLSRFCRGYAGRRWPGIIRPRRFSHRAAAAATRLTLSQS